MAEASGTGTAATGERRAAASGQSRGLRTVVAAAVPPTRVRLRGAILDDDADEEDDDEEEEGEHRSMTHRVAESLRAIPPSLASRTAATIAFDVTNSPRLTGDLGPPAAPTTTTRSQRQSSGADVSRVELEWGVDVDEAWMPKPARLHSGKTRSCIVCFAPLQFTSMQSWDEYVQSAEYLQRLQENLLSDAFISSLICGENTSGGDLPTEYRMHKNRKLKCRQSVHDYVNMVSAGVIDEAYKEKSSVRILEEMLLHGLSTPLFAGVLERRLAVISHSTEIARKLMQESQSEMQRLPREVAPARPNVELHHLAIQTLSALLQSFDCTMNNAALQAFEEMARLLSCFPALSLYSFWSPVQRPPELPLVLAKTQVDASSCATTPRLMAAEFAIDGSETSFWQSHARPGVTFFSMRHAELSKVASIAIRWHLKCFPKSVGIQYRLTGSDVFCPLMEQHASATNGPEYFEVKLPRKCDEVRLVLSGIPLVNRSACFAIEDVKLNIPVTNSLFVDPKTTLSDVSEWLLSASTHTSEDVVVEAISALRAWSLATASLGSILTFVRMLLKMKEVSPVDSSGAARFAVREAHALIEGLKAYRADELERVAKGGGKKSSSESRKIRGLFEPACCSSGVTIEDGGMVVRTRETSYQYAAVNVGISSGRASWKFRLDNDTVDDEMTCFGAAILPVTVSGYDSSPNLWMLRGYNGNLYARGHKLSRSIGKVHPGDTVQIDVDMNEGTLAYKINDTDYGPVFTDLAGHEVYPAVSFYGSGKVITLLGVEKWDESEAGGSTIDPVYLSNLKEYHYSVGYGSLGKGSQLGYASDADSRTTAASGPTPNSSIQIAGEAKQRCLSLHPPARGEAFVLYDLGEGYSTISGAVAINDDVQNDVLRQRAVAVLFSIVGDGTTLWQSKPITQVRTLETFNIDVRSVRMLELRISCPGSNHCAHSIWVDPHVIPLEDWKCSECKVSNKAALSHCMICSTPQSRSSVATAQGGISSSSVAATKSSKTSVVSSFDEAVNLILGEVVELTQIGRAPNAMMPLRFEQPYCRQPCEVVLLHLLAMISSLQQEVDTDRILLQRSLYALGLIEANLKSIAMYDITPHDLGIKKSTITALKSVLEAIAFGSQLSQSTSELEGAAAKALIAGLPMLYTPAQKIQLLLALLRGCSDMKYKPQSAKQVVLTSMLATLALPGRDGVLNFLPCAKLGTTASISDEEMEQLKVSDIEEVVFLLVSTACKIDDGSSDDPIAHGSMKLLQSYQLMLLAEALELTQKKVAQPNDEDSGRLQAARIYVQEATINYASLLLRYCGNVLTRLIEQHAEDVLMLEDPQAAAEATDKLNARTFNLPILSKLLPWLISCLCLLRRQSWLAIPVLPSVVKFSSALNQACAELSTVKSSEARIRRLERSIKARQIESQLVERMLATDKTLAMHHQASKPMYNVFKQLYTGDKDHFEGQIGFQFEATSTFSIIALGRSVNPTKNGGTLVRQHTVRLWEEASQTLIAQVTVGATSRKDPLGYVVEALSAPVKLTQGKLYRLTTQEYANGGDPWYKKENLPDEEYDASYIKILRDCYASGSTSFPNSQNLSGAAYGVPTFLVEGENPLNKLPKFLASFGSTSLKFSIQKKSAATLISHSGTSAHVLDGGNDVWRTCFLQTAVMGGVHAIDFIVKCGKPGGVSSGHVCVGVDWSPHQSVAKSYAFLGATATSIGWMPSIGSLWTMGQRIQYGKQKQVNIGDILTIVVDMDHNLLSFLHNGVDMGVAVGPTAYSSCSSLPAETQALPPKLVVGFSLNGTLDVVQVRPSGLTGSTLRLHWLLDLHNTTASFAGRLCSTLIAGNPVDGVEEELLPWLQSPLLSGGATSVSQASGSRDESLDWHNEYQAEEARWKHESLPTPQPSTAAVRPLTRLERVKSEGAAGKPRLVKRSSFFDEIGLDESIFLEDLTTNMGDSGPAALVITWLEKVSPDRSFLSRLGKFPLCERPTCAALIKHSPIHILHEVQAIISSAKTLDGKYSTDHIDLVPSDDLVSIWKRIVMMRHWLIKSRQEYRARAVTEDTDGGDATQVETAQEMSSPSSLMGELDMHISVPRTFDELISQLQDRAMFLCVLNPPTEERERMRVESQVALSNLAEKWSAQNTPPSLEPMLERWKSLTESDSSKWSGIVDVLRAQHRWRARRASVSLASRPQDSSSSSAEATGAVAPRVDAEEEEDPIAASATTPRKDFKYRSSFAAMVRACDLYIRNGIGAPPEILRALLERRQRRSECRTFGLDAMKSLITSLSMDSTRHSAIIFLRPAFRGFTEDEKESRDLNDGVVVAETFRATVRHHYLKGLEGCSRRTLQRVQRSFWNLYTVLASLIAPAGSNHVDSVDSSLKQAIICSWCLDFEPRDHSYLLKSGLLTTLQNEFSMGTILQRTHDEMHEIKLLQDARASGDCVAVDGAELNWHPLTDEFIQRGAVSTGLVTKRDILHLILRAPSHACPRAWWRDNGLQSSDESVTTRLTVSAVSLRYAELLNNLRTKVSRCQERTLARKVVQFGVGSSSSGSGQSGSSLKADQVSYAEVPALGSTVDFTLEMWIYATEVGSYRALWADNGFQSGSAYVELLDRHLQVSINGNVPREQLFKNFRFDTFTWTHIAVVYTAATRCLELVVNGRLRETKLYDRVGKAVVFREARLGCWLSESIESSSPSTSSVQRVFKGSIAELRLWKATRTPVQIARDFQRAVPYETSSGDTGDSLLLGVWHLDEGEGACGVNRLESTHGRLRAGEAASVGGGNASLVACHWIHSSVPVWSNSRVDEIGHAEWERTTASLRSFQRVVRRRLVSKNEHRLHFARELVQREERAAEWHYDDDSENEDEDDRVPGHRPSKLGYSSALLNILASSTDDVVINDKQVKHCAWIVFRLLSHMAICGTQDRTDSEATTIAAAAKSRRKLRIQSDGGAGSATSSPMAAASRVPPTFEEDQGVTKVAELASDAAKTAASSRQLEEPALQMLWFSNEMHRKVFEIVERELGFATAMIQTAEGLTRAQRMVRSTSTPVQDRDMAIRSHNSVSVKRKQSIGAASHGMRSFLRSSDSSGSTLEPLEVEAYVFGILTFVLSQSTSHVARTHLGRPRVLRELLQLLRLGSPRAQRLVKLILRCVCSSGGTVGPRDVAGILGSEAMLVDLLLDQVAESVCSTAAPIQTVGLSMSAVTAVSSSTAPITESLANPVGFRSGQVYLAAASESVALLRLLLLDQQWGTVVSELLSSAVKNVAPILARRTSEKDSTASDIRTRAAVVRAVGALCVLGSHTDCLRIGGKVQVSTKETSHDGVDYGFTFGGGAAASSSSSSASSRAVRPTLATLIEINARSSSARVVFESNDDQSDPTHNVQEINLAMVSPVEEVQLPGSGNSTPLSVEMMPVILKLASLAPSDVIDSFDDLWRMQIRSRALLAFESILRHPHAASYHGQIPPSLLDAALRPVELSTFVSVPFLQERGRMILCRLIEASTPFGDPMFRGLPDPVAKASSAAVDAEDTATAVESTEDPVEEETEEYRIRRGFASTLAAMGFEFDLCMAALDHSRNDPNAAVEWLMGAGAIEYQARQEARRLATAAVTATRSTGERPRDTSDGVLGEDATLIARAEELQSISGMPLRLAYCALEMANGDPNRAMEWLMEHGSRYADKAESMALLGDELRADKSLALSDAAALEGIDQPDALVTNASHETAIDADALGGPTASGGGAGDPSTIMAVTLAPILAPLPEKPSAASNNKKNKPTQASAASPGPGFAPLNPDYLTPYVLLTVSHETGPVQRLAASGRTGVFRSYSLKDGVLITFLNTETGAYEDEWHPPTNVRRITQLYDEPLDGVASVHRVALRTEKALATHYARRGVAALLHSWEAAASNVLTAVGGPRKFVNLLKLVAASEMVFSRPSSRAKDKSKPTRDPSVDRKNQDAAKRDEPLSILHDLQAIALRILQDEAERGSSSSSAVAGQVPATESGDEDERDLRAAIALSMRAMDETKEEEDADFLVRRTRLPSYSEAQQVASAYLGGSVEDHDGLLSTVLVKECVSHFVESTRVAGQGDSSHPQALQEFQSLHPYYGRCDYTRAVVFDPSHRSLRVKFDQRCKLGAKAKLTFYADASCTKVLLTVDAASTTTPLSDFLIHSHQFWFKFTSAEDDLIKPHGYGFRFQVQPMPRIAWASEKEVATNASLEWACWVLAFLLHDAAHLVAHGAVHNAQIYGALVRYVRSPSAPFKSRVVRLLIQLLDSPDQFPITDMPDLAPLEGISSLAIAHATRERDAGKLFLSAPLLQLIELSVVARRASAVFDRARLKNHEASPVITSADLVLPTAIDQQPMPDTLHDLVSIAKFLLGHTSDLPPRVLLAVWLDVFGAAEMIETDHPYGPQSKQTGAASFPGARAVLMTFDSRCSTLPAAQFDLHLVPDSSFPEPSVIWWTYCGQEQWPAGPDELKGGTSVTYEFTGGENPDALYGISASVFAVGLSPEQQLARCSEEHLADLLDTLRQQRDAKKGWTPAMDSQLIDWVNATVESMAAATNSTASAMLSTELKPSEVRLHRTRDALRCSLLLDTSWTQLQLRFSLLKHWNQLLKRAMPLLDLRDIVSPWTVAHLLRQLGHCIFFDLKTALVDAAIEATSTPGDTNNSTTTARITLDRLQALESRDDREVEPSVSECFFAQAFRQLHHQVEPAWFRRKIDNKGRLFSVKFRGEEGVDWGGVYREGVNSMVDDLFSSHFSLFVLCPNGQHDTGTNRAMYLPNPKCTSPIAIQMFEFVGKLLGISLRTRGDFPFAFPSLVWKQLIGQPLDRSDLDGTDAMFVQMLDGIQHCERDGILTEDEFDAAFQGLDLRFTAFDCNGHEVELVEDGKAQRVGYTNRLEYCRLAETYRLYESSTQVAAMTRGLATVFPLRVLTVLTWHEMEMLTCGSPKIDIALWKQHTRYDGYSEHDDTVKLFWEAMASFTDEQRSDFVRFAWGRSRLPRGKWPQPFKLTKKGGRDSTLSLPVAHTCFFSVELPPYTTLDKMRSMLLATINFGLGGILMA